jgi:putative addiction module component (TIGR02574 family)
MNQDNAKSPAPGTPKNGAAGVQTPSKIEVDLEALSYSLARDLARIPREDWSRIESVPCRVGFTRDMAEGIRFVDAVANVVNQHGGLFATRNMDKRRDLEKCSEQIVDAFRRLPVDERVRLVEELWDEVARELEQRPLSEAERHLLDERIRQHNETPTDVDAWETARDDILRDL